MGGVGLYLRYGDSPEVHVAEVVVDDATAAHPDYGRALVTALRKTADRIEAILPGAGCDHQRLVPRLPCAECDPRDPLKARFG